MIAERDNMQDIAEGVAKGLDENYNGDWSCNISQEDTSGLCYSCK